MAGEDNTMLKAVVFIVTFSALFSFMYAYSNAAFKELEPPNPDDFLNRNFDPQEMANMTYWQNDSLGTGYVHNVTEDADWGSYVIEPLWNSEPTCDGSRFDFYKPDSDQRVRVYPIGDDVDDDSDNMAEMVNSFLIYQQWGWWDREWESISFANVLINLEISDQSVKSNVHIDLKGGMNVYFLFPVGSTANTVQALLEDGYGFQIVLGQSFLDELESSNNAWNALSGLLTFQIDTGIEVLNYLISLPIYVTIAFIAFYIIKELIS